MKKFLDMDFEEERKEKPCDNQMCRYWGKAYPQYCTREETGNPGPSFCTGYVPKYYKVLIQQGETILKET